MLLIAEDTTNNPGFLRMKFKHAAPKTPFQRLLKIARPGFASTVHHAIICVAGKRIVRKLPFHSMAKFIRNQVDR